MRPKVASMTSPSGPSTVTPTSSPPRAATRASTVPSPPSATGTSSTSASGSARRTPSAIALAAAGAPREPLKGLDAATTFKAVGRSNRSVDRQRPVSVLGVVASDGLEVDLLQLLGELAHPPVRDRPAVHLDHRRDLRPGPAEEDLVADVELRAVDASLDHGHLQLLTDQPDHQAAGDPLQDVVGDRRGREHAVLQDEEVLGRS